MEPHRLRVAMDEILDAMTMSENDPIRFFLDLESGSVESGLNPDVYEDLGGDETEFDRLYQESPERFDEIPKYAGRDEYNLMCEFADAIDEDDIRERLDVALQEARAVFKSLARELCEYHGIAWRKRFIENTSHFDCERAHLEVDGTTVRLFVDVPLAAR